MGLIVQITLVFRVDGPTLESVAIFGTAVGVLTEYLVLQRAPLVVLGLFLGVVVVLRGFFDFSAGEEQNGEGEYHQPDGVGLKSKSHCGSPRKIVVGVGRR